MSGLELIGVPVITIIVYWTINLIKHALKEKEGFKRIIPLLSAVFGAVLGVIGFYVVPEIIFSQNIFTALLTGGASGLSATGANQIIKQLRGGTEDEENENDT